MVTDRPTRATIVSHTYVVAANRAKVERLFTREGLVVQLVVPQTWWERDERRLIRAEPRRPEPYDLRVLPARALAPAFYWFRQEPFRQALQEFNPHLVHVEEEPWSLAALQVALLKPRLGFRLSLFAWENLDRILPLPSRVIQRFVLRRVDRLVAGSKGAERVMRARGYRGRADVLPQLGVDLAHSGLRCGREERRRRGLREFVVGYVGRLVPQKGVDHLLDAFAWLDADASLLIVGQGPFLGELQARARHLGIHDRVVFSGGVPHSDVLDYFGLMDVLVLPSLTTPKWKEQFGHVLIEAMACGVPVVGSSSGEIPVVIGDAGLIFAEGDRNALSVCLSRLRDPELGRRLAEAGRARVLRHYTNDALATALARVFRDEFELFLERTGATGSGWNGMAVE